MYRPKAFRVDDSGALIGFVREHPLATFVTVGSQGIEITHLPMFFVDGNSGALVLRGHIARANEQWSRTDTDIAGVAMFREDSHYISPGWYASKREHGRVVPTYDYVAVEARGPVRFFHDPAKLCETVTRLTSIHEARVGGTWSIDDAPAEYVEAQLRAIVGVELEVESIAGAFKLSQNRSDADITGTVAGLEALKTPQALSIAALIRSYAPSKP